MATNKKPYYASIGHDSKWYVHGPGNGTDYYGGVLWPNMRLSSKADAEAAALIANEAFKQGAEYARAEIRSALGVS